VVISVVAFALGYQARTYFTSSQQAAKSIPSSSTSGPVDLTDKPKSKSIPTSGSGSDSDSESELDTDSEAEDLALALSSNPQSLKPTSFDEVKLVLIVNESLKMTKGKIAAQAGHATLSCALMMKDVNPRMYKHWERHG
jgi:PTH2 family peptidyl-tRNA hydrolase